MLTAIIATHESEQTLVPTLTALVPGATCGLVTEVIVADAGSRDATAEIADIAGCRFMHSNQSLGTRLREAAQSARTPWLLFLRPGTVPDHGWIDAVSNFIDTSSQTKNAARAAFFRRSETATFLRPVLSEMFTLLRLALGGGLRPEQGLLIARRFYEEIGGHQDKVETEAALLRKIGRRRILMLPVGARTSGTPVTGSGEGQ